MAFNLDDYEPVENRITSFWLKFPAGRIITSIVAVDEKMIVMKAEIYTDREDQRPATVDFAQEYIGGSKLTMNSWLEVCATSAIGRALADLDFVKTKGKRPSREEMRKAVPEPKTSKLVGDALIVSAMEHASEGNLEALRALYAEAQADNQPAAVLDEIQKIAKPLAEAK
jgi:DNA-binding transcriptional regulator YbjK